MQDTNQTVEISISSNPQRRTHNPAPILYNWCSSITRGVGFSLLKG